MLGSLLVSLVLARGYGLDDVSLGSALESGEAARRVDGDWVSVPFGYSGGPATQRLRLTVDASACARVVRHQVTETSDRVIIVVWRRQVHPSCSPLTVSIDLRAPLGDRRVIDGGVIAP